MALPVLSGLLSRARTATLTFEGLKKLGVVLKRAQYFITCNGKGADGLKLSPQAVLQALIAVKKSWPVHDTYSINGQSVSLAA